MIKKYRIALHYSVLLAMITLSLVHFFSFFDKSPLLPNSNSLSDNSVPLDFVDNATLIHGQDFTQTLGVVWFFGVIFLYVRLGFGLLRLNQLRQKSDLFPNIYLQKVIEWADKLSIPRNIYLGVSNRVQGPCSFGYFRKVILIPASYLLSVPPDQMELIILHEMIHIKNRDYLLTLFQRFVEIVLFFQPMVWLISKDLDSFKEMRCDEEVVHFSKDPHAYSKILMLSQESAPTLASGLFLRSSLIFRRIKRVLDPSVVKSPIQWPGFILAFGLLFLLGNDLVERRRGGQDLHEPIWRVQDVGNLPVSLFRNLNSYMQTIGFHSDNNELIYENGDLRIDKIQCPVEDLGAFQKLGSVEYLRVNKNRITVIHPAFVFDVVITKWGGHSGYLSLSPDVIQLFRIRVASPDWFEQPFPKTPDFPDPIPLPSNLGVFTKQLTGKLKTMGLLDGVLHQFSYGPDRIVINGNIVPEEKGKPFREWVTSIIDDPEFIYSI